VSALTVGGWYGRVGVEIISGSDCVAVVGRMQANRLDALDKVRSASAKRDERAHYAEVEAQVLEAGPEAARALACRIVACVNALAGIPTEDLERIAVLEPYLRLLKVSHLADRQAATFEEHPDHEYVAAGAAQ